MLKGVLAIAKAARKDADVSVADLRAGNAAVADKPVARKLREGFEKTVLGQAIKLDAQTLLVAGELDEQCSAEFVEACTAVLELGVSSTVTESGITVFAVAGDFAERALVGVREIVVSMLDTLRTLLVRWSAVRLVDETANVCEVLDEITKVVAVCDRILWNECHEQISEARNDWSTSVVAWKQGMIWPPKVNNVDADFSSLAAESAMAMIVGHIIEYGNWATGKFPEKDSDLHKSHSSVVAEAVAAQSNHNLRKAMVQEMFIVQKLLRHELKAPEDEFALLMRNEEGSLTLAEELIVIHHDYKGVKLEPSAQHAFATVRILADRQHANDDVVGEKMAGDAGVVDEDGDGEELVDHGTLVSWTRLFTCGEMRSWVDREHIGASFESYSKQFFDVVMPLLQVASVEAAKAQDCPASPRDVLHALIPAAEVQKLVDSVKECASGDVGIDEQSAEKLCEKSRIARCSQGVLRLLLLRDGKAKAPIMTDTWGDEWECDALSNVVRALSGYANVLQLAALLSYECLGSAERIFIADPSAVAGAGNEKSAYVAPLFTSAFRALQQAVQLWPTLKQDASNVGECGTQIDQMDTAITFIGQSWMPATMAASFDILLAQLRKSMAMVDDASPKWATIITHAKYNAAMARKTLMADGVVHRLLQSQGALHALSCSISSVAAEIGYSAAAVKELTEEADGVIDHARATMVVMAGVAVVEGSAAKGDRSAHAEQCLKEKGIPESLRAKLRGLVTPV